MMFPFGWPRATVATLLVAGMASCGGKTVVDQGGGGGAAGATSSGTTSSGTTSSGTTSSGTSSSSTSGAGGSPGWSCPQLEADYTTQLELARLCAPEMSSLQCTIQVDDQLPCPCPTFVNPKNAAAVAQLENLRQAWNTHDCGETIDCPGMPCTMPPGAFCEPQPPSSMAPGLCKDGL